MAFSPTATFIHYSKLVRPSIRSYISQFYNKPVGRFLSCSVGSSFIQSVSRPVYRHGRSSCYQSVSQSFGDRTVRNKIRMIRQSCSQTVSQSDNQTDRRKLTRLDSSELSSYVNQAAGPLVSQSVCQPFSQSCNQSVFQTVSETIKKYVYLSDREFVCHSVCLVRQADSQPADCLARRGN